MILADYAVKSSRFTVNFISFVSVIILGVIDYLTGPWFGFSIFYLLPVIGITWYVDKQAGIILSFFAAATCLVSEMIWGVQYSHPLIQYWNAVVSLCFFITVSVLLSMLKLQCQTLEQKINEKTADIIRLNRLYTVVSSVNQAIIRIRDEQELFDTVCRIATNKGKLSMALIGMIDEQTKSVKINSWAGYFNNCMINQDLAVDDSSPVASPMILAISNGEHFICNNIEKDKRALPWRDRALESSYKSCASFPLKRGLKCIGTFTFYSDEMDFFDIPEIDVLDEMVQDVSFFLEILEREKERNLAEEALRESEQKYKSFFNDDLTGDYSCTPDGKILSCNPAFACMFGFATIDEVLSVNTTALYSSPEKFQQFIAQLTKEKKLEYIRIEMRRRNGQPLHVIANLMGIFNADGQLVEIKGYLFDDTKREQLEQQLIQAQKLESLGILAGGIAHDFNNILCIILGHSALIEYHNIDFNKFRKSVEAIIKAAERGTALVKQLLTFAHKTETVFESVQVNEIVVELTKLAQETFPKTIVISTKLAKKLPLILADASQIHQVLLNLYVNARDAMSDGGILSIKTSTVKLKTVRYKYPKATAKEYIFIKVSDTGTGIDKKIIQRIFEPFFSTKGPSKGTGLGLSLAYSIVENHHGFIDVSSQLGKGTVFNIYLPVEEGKIKIDITQRKLIEDIPGGTETILLIEDEDMIRELVRSILVSKGYKVLTAQDGEKGLHEFVIHQKEIVVVLCDLGLPKMSGDEVFRRIRSINPKADVILASGFIDPQMKSDLQRAGAKFFIQKPYSIIEVLQALRGIINK
jgi:PAS domain S-box-containing protein